MYETVELLVKSFIMLFVIMDPPGNVPVFLAITKDMSEERRKKEFREAIIVAAVLLFVFAFLGRLILEALGISIESFMVAGGILLLFTALDLMRGEKRYVRGGDVGAVPMGTPLLAGPGAITTVMIIQSWGFSIVLFAIVSAIVATKIILDFSLQIYNILGEEGSEVLSRVMGIIVAAIAIEFIRKGVTGMVTMT
ncbi:MAG: Small neutral amino acid transporter SnatA [Candidatus Alkanophagales archaeon MCA70_species_1]|nr:Small neutral amino acid transporter SnatA [Candidatus Alkanophaga volatiphilum]